jgi:hypothetical protein
MIFRTVGQDILDQWSWIEPLLAKAQPNVLEQHFTTGHWLADILAGQAFIMVAGTDDDPDQSICLIYPKRSTIHLEAWAGKNMDYMREGMNKVKEYAEGLGVDYITSRSRPGAAKVLKAEGFKVHDYYMKFEVSTWAEE